MLIFPHFCRSVSEIIEAIEDISKRETRSTVQDSLPFISNKLISQFEREITITDQIFEVGYFIYLFFLEIDLNLLGRDAMRVGL